LDRQQQQQRKVLVVLLLLLLPGQVCCLSFWMSLLRLFDAHGCLNLLVVAALL
jgi:hypothetical protein